MISRRAFLSSATALALGSSVSSLSRPAAASARVPYGGRLVLHVPWSLSSIDPHRIDDATAALFGEALFDTLYGIDEAGAFVPVLAEDDPRAEGGSLRVPMRAGVRFASGAPLDARAAAASLA